MGSWGPCLLQSLMEMPPQPGDPCGHHDPGCCLHQVGWVQSPPGMLGQRRVNMGS